MKANLKKQALSLRKMGKSYRDILGEVPVAKSTLSYWLRTVEMSRDQIEILRKRRIESARRGSLKRKVDRIKKTDGIIREAYADIKNMGKIELLIIGTCLYWAEGAKQRTHNVSQRVCFANSDPKMVKIFLLWLDRICNTRISDLIFELYIHKSADFEMVSEYWKRELGIKILLVRFKKHKPETNRRKTDDDYKGLMRITVRKSTDLNRKISGWIEAIAKQWGVV